MWWWEKARMGCASASALAAKIVCLRSIEGAEECCRSCCICFYFCRNTHTNVVASDATVALLLLLKIFTQDFNLIRVLVARCQVIRTRDNLYQQVLRRRDGVIVAWNILYVLI